MRGGKDVKVEEMMLDIDGKSIFEGFWRDGYISVEGGFGIKEEPVGNPAIVGCKLKRFGKHSALQSIIFVTSSITLGDMREEV